ncbi:putative quinol monooxygenase [Beijerinckia indica]|uniref:Antibiotic biosynthesis monooxygenase n=1 Tax=Beijerinckia indica subsp. indica (strain ATCC 9039 / DSM 1715 / NCIMB 8712) TaxID=395963 RepID=B2IHG0_BEII9|nr:putative quinol monooxygenase [Beijerinckia indica]ACB95945.1 Antibiotic biosynthesis monooxygenase [Beijerinckia indica subsp. indica ATCC 9039]
MSEEISLVAIVTAKPGTEAQVQAAIGQVVEPSRAEAGNISYIPHRDLDNPARFVFVERWASRAALAEHEKTAHFQAFAGTVVPLLAEPLQIIILQPL